MDVHKAITERRAYRSLEKVEIDMELVRDLAESARIAPSCFNNQPWRFVFAYGEEKLNELFPVLTSGNKWATYSSMIIAVCSHRDLDCLVKGREYYLFDTGMATAFIILRATELGLVAHPIAGYDEEETKKILEIPDDMTVITLVIVGKRSSELNPVLSDDQRKRELARPERIPLEEFAFVDSYGG
ncbi:MAG: nitroreductase family protein [Theionarchaea archaeon]|nr:nitroreductase family protein [Theionarchaea archaeon]